MRNRAAVAAIIALVASASMARADDGAGGRFRATMDSVFGAGAWRETGGYRTPERENELRAQGALTVPPGVLSHHSMGRPGDPGAYDLVVHGLSPGQAAEKLRRAGAPFRTFAEGAHGGQGPHLHLEVASGRTGATPHAPGIEWTVADPTPAQLEVTRLRREAEQGRAAAQQRLGQIYAQGRVAPKDLVAAYVWTAQAATNGAADPAARREAEVSLAALARTMKPADLQLARRFVEAPVEEGAANSSDCGARSLASDPSPVLLIGAADRAATETPAPCAKAAGDALRVTAG